MIDVSPYPMCAARLKFFRANTSEDGFSYYWAAVAIVADISDKALKAFGGFDFSDKSDANGKQLLARLDQMISQGRHKKAKSDVAAMTPAEISIRSSLGAYGVKVSKLDGVDDYWKCARVLWPDHIEENPKVRDVYTLDFQIKRIGKKARSASAAMNRKALKPRWRAFQ